MAKIHADGSMTDASVSVPEEPAQPVDEPAEEMQDATEETPEPEKPVSKRSMRK